MDGATIIRGTADETTSLRMKTPLTTTWQAQSSVFALRSLGIRRINVHRREAYGVFYHKSLSNVVHLVTGAFSMHSIHTAVVLACVF
ncbi:hypothetical protein SPI_00682 [Niveomyces insectorum RCEF 264]|uniref:Uncharacterized protein n=1 Tax=Niveomyces insectorum RCEF 264 TaxID=1081102 RepID=A0A168AAN8_9HYPO|nr:hypothetical protein SPI_00682 [Niveomyces insectorum RCEF 264]